MLQEARQIKNIVVLVLRHIHSLHLMNFEVAWALVSSGTQVQPPQIILDPGNIPDYEYFRSIWTAVYRFWAHLIWAPTR